MTFRWQKAGTFPREQSPYIHWFWDFDDIKVPGAHGEDAQSRDFRSEKFASFLSTDRGLDSFRSLLKSNALRELTGFNFAKAADVTDGLNKSAFAARFNEAYLPYDEVPIPHHARDATAGTEVKDIDPDLLEEVPDDTVLIGVIDSGIALGSTHFRLADGMSTRFVSAWQQTAAFQGQDFVPFGNVVTAKEINARIRQHSKGQYLDEDAFNRDLELVQQHHMDGQRDLDFNAAHGAHVASLAAGRDPFDPEQAKDLKKSRIIAVNLPTQRLHGSAGNFLAFWAIRAVDHMIRVADVLWKKKHGNPIDGKGWGYPLVVNFSYGMHAGPKNGTSKFEIELAALLGAANSNGRAPVRVVLPAGNDNLERGQVKALMGVEKKHKVKLVKRLSRDREYPISWNVQPEDHTGNFAELWVTEHPETRSYLENNADNLTIFVTPPGQDEIAVPALAVNEYAELGNFARVYRQNAVGSLGYLICINRTASVDGATNLTPAGRWSIDVEYKGKAAHVAVYIQSDQSGLVHSARGRRSYFETTNAPVYQENGRLRDSFNYAANENETIDTDDWRVYGPLQIKGTTNALATSLSVISIAGFRQSDGRPASYSATTDGNSYRRAQIEVLDAAFPSEIAPAHFGLLASGSRDGTTALLRGTSMSAGLATRFLAETLKQWKPNLLNYEIARKQDLRDFAGNHFGTGTENRRRAHYGEINKLKMSVGRIPKDKLPKMRQVGRVSNYPGDTP